MEAKCGVFSGKITGEKEKKEVPCLQGTESLEKSSIRQLGEEKEEGLDGIGHILICF